MPPRTSLRCRPVRGWRGEDSNLRRREPTGLQPVPVDRFGTSPRKILCPSSPIAPERTREQKDPAPPSPPEFPGGAGANLSLFCVAVLSTGRRVALASPRSGGSSVAPARGTELARGLE